MKPLRFLVIFALALLIIWIDLPKNKIIPPFKVDIQILGARIHKTFETQLGLDLKGGSHLVFQADTSKIPQEDLQDALNSARDIIERRINFYGVSEPSIQTIRSGDNYRISIDLPGVTNVHEAVMLVGKTAQLTFREEILTKEKIATTTPAILLLQKQTGLTGKDVKKATVQFDQQTGKPQVALSFSEKGRQLFADITKRNVGKQVGIFVDELLISAPVVQQVIYEGSAVISGSFTVDEAKQLAVAINSGTLPLPIKLIEQRSIGPSLGAEEVQKSVYAGVVGLFAVVLFMVLYYGRFGFIASIALLIYGLLSLAIFKAIPIVLTLAGVAGFILSIGMAVDSNILIFERIKEEMRKGRELRAAIRIGFGRAIDAIKDANITTLAVALILFNPLSWDFLPQFGLVKGFAVTLLIGVTTSLFTGVFITKRLIQFFTK